MNKTELIQELQDDTGLSRTDAQKAVDALFDADDGIIAAALKRGDRVQLTGFGTFESRKRSGRMGRNPRTGQEIKIGPSTTAAFKVSKRLKDSLS